ncbi:hypothetical protein H6G76_09415 [Nostoc sp. FACHB-152]|uniref:hypothetical protein n=1 Tax=unclassified Nostoc TaxID=2593658 RepID=UPI001688CD85|nr:MULTISPECIES: hypothetical protein [unclassified Nostoc]MBD2447384.1 hypothetical protein [Nostoc sp. FACHB-152]MBD2473283.1 hypothetical protein [Nostoc sp. FACHB-145]
MMRNFHKTFVVVAIIATFASGCRSTDEYKKFAEAGNSFAEATNSLLMDAEKITINTTSERLLNDRRTSGEFQPSDEAAKNFVARYTKLSEEDKNRLELIKELRRHNQFLQAYFNKLIELTGSDSPERSKTAVESIASNLQNSGSKLVSRSPIKIDRLPSVTKIVLDARIRGALKEELEKRKYTIYQEITTQEKILKQISDSVEKDITELRKLQEYRLVLKPLTQSEEVDDNTWIETRYKVLTQDAEVVTKIKDASEKLTKFKELFIASIEGDLTSKRLDNFIQETNSFSALVYSQQ